MRGYLRTLPMCDIEGCSLVAAVAYRGQRFCGKHAWECLRDVPSIRYQVQIEGSK